MQPSSAQWFRNTVLYQIYPRSFYDSNGDGIGDLRGITQKLKYLKGDFDSLGIGAIWISPFYPSPMKDFGYDITDHCAVDPLFGNMDDFEQLLDEAHSLGIRVLIDLIPNHTSDLHDWFKESRNLNSPRRDWYIWRDPGPDGGSPNNWLSVFGGSAWEYDETTKQYYLHSFLKEQPDLNWENAGVRAAIKQIMCFWLDKGVDGFRTDAVYWMAKDLQFRDDPENKDYMLSDDPYNSLLHINSKQSPKFFSYMRFMTDVLHKYTDKFMVVEAAPAFSTINESYLDLYSHVDASVCAPFNFEGIYLPWKAAKFKEYIDRFQAGMHPAYVPVYCMGNHDQPRIATRLSSMASKSAAVLQLTLPGMPVVYYGDELGMVNAGIAPEKVQDPFELRVPGLGLGRDPQRTPMQWDLSANAGFSKYEPWLPVNGNYLRVNAEVQSQNPRSHLNLYKKLLDYRADSECLRGGSYESIEIHKDVFCFERALPGQKVLVTINFSDDLISLNNPVFKGDILITSYMDMSGKPVNCLLSLRPNEAVVIEIDSRR